jgi:hypothetical protein
MLKRVNFLWDSNEIYNEWKQSLGKRPKTFIEDLNLEQIYEELNSISSFIDFSIHKNTIMYPCTALSTIQYRQSIIKALYESIRLHKAVKEFTIMLRDVHKKLITVNKTKDEVKKSIFYLQLYHEFLYKLQDFYNEFESIIPENNIFNNLTAFLSEYVLPDQMIDARESLTQVLSKLDQLYSFHIILNKKEEQAIYSAAIDDNTEPDKGSKNDSVRDNFNNIIDVNPSDSCIGNNCINFSDNLMSISRFMLEDYDFNISVYQDVDITAFDKELQDRVMNKSPEVSADINRLYSQYKDFPFSDFFDMSDELIFYITFIDFIHFYEQAGFYFTLPESRADNSRLSVEGAYDLSLGINRYRNNKTNNVVSNSYSFDEQNRIFILTGANQGGKTTFLRSIGLIQCLYQIGVYVPARSASLCMVSQVYTHFSRPDEASAGAGRFEQELILLQQLLAGIKPNDMFLLNEPFTSTQRSIAVVLLKQALLELSSRGCFGGLVTHFFEITNRLPGQPFFSLVTLVNQDDSFSERTYRITKRLPDNKSHADDIARKCGVTYEQLIEDIQTRL